MKKLQITIVASILIILLTACNQGDEENAAKEETVTPVETTSVKKGNLLIERSVYGRTAPSSTTAIKLQAAGEITNLEVKNGDMVEEDDMIATIQTRAGTQTIYADTAGEIAQLQGEEGAIVSVEKPLAVIVDLDELALNLTVTADTTSLFERGKKYPTVINDTKLDAEITSVGTLPNETGLYPIEATIPNDNRQFLPGMVVELNVPKNKIEDAFLVPTEAVIEESGTSFIYIIKENKAIKKEINIIETRSDKTAFEGHVNKGDQVVTSGKLTLVDGSKVKVMKEG